MRLMQFGFTVYYVGETITPRIQPGNLLIAHLRFRRDRPYLRSGETGPQPAGPHCRPHGPWKFGNRPTCRFILTIPGTTKLNLAKENSHQCPGSLFEQAAYLFLEAVVMQIFHLRLGFDQEQILARHADLE